MPQNAYTAAAQTLTHAPLGIGGLTVSPDAEAAAVPTTAGNAVVATFIGSPSAELAIAVRDPEVVLAETGGQLGVGLADVLQPTLAAAAEQLGSGVLGDARIEDATHLFADASAHRFTVTDPAGQQVAWFAIRGDARTAPTGAATDVAGRLGRISNVEMALTVEIGRTRMSVRDVLAVEPGTVIELDRSAGSPADILLNGRLIAHGEIVVVDQDYAVRVTQILDTADALV
ncbi:flagellar motor switch protein FliN [Leifsonia sp. EB34]|uniref:flagellar motor switch protein FliN n=1 Tax=Leifsonia sp. EB34 TaxID=3156303 RepID=UPI0035187ACC